MASSVGEDCQGRADPACAARPPERPAEAEGADAGGAAVLGDTRRPARRLDPPDEGDRLAPPQYASRAVAAAGATRAGLVRQIDRHSVADDPVPMLCQPWRSWNHSV